MYHHALPPKHDDAGHCARHTLMLQHVRARNFVAQSRIMNSSLNSSISQCLRIMNSSRKHVNNLVLDILDGLIKVKKTKQFCGRL